MKGKNLTRRSFIKGAVAAAVSIGGNLPLPAEGGKEADQKRAVTGGPPRKIGLALGGGGAKGLAHVVMLELLDEMGIRPHRMAGTSIGAIIGAMYASGVTALEIREVIDKLVVSEHENWAKALARKDVLKWIEFIDPGVGHGGLLRTDGFITFLSETIKCRTFEELQIPLSIVAADLRSREEVIFQSGELSSAVKASMSIPGVFAPVHRDGMILVDGGAVNPVPYDLLIEECDLTIAIDVLGKRSDDDKEDLSFFDTIFGTIQVMQEAIVAQKMKYRRPDIYIKPPIAGVHVLEFNKANDVYRQSSTAREELKAELLRVLS